MAFAFVFPGQGSQSLKMMDGLLDFPDTERVFATAKQILAVDFLALLREESADNINQTVNTQPLMLVSGYANYLAWRNKNGKAPNIVAGHSLGEWTALVVAGVISFEDALNLVKLRAEAMQESVPAGHGAMAAVLGLPDDKIIEICANVEHKHGGVVAGVNFNSPGQVVIAGDKETVAAASIELKNSGARKVQMLSVSVPSHCKLMLPAAAKLADRLASIKFKPPQIEVLHNYNAETYTNVEQIKDALVKQLYSPVLWTATINKIVEKSILHIAECGPGKVLTSLNKRINANIISYALHNQDDFKRALSELN